MAIVGLLVMVVIASRAPPGRLGWRWAPSSGRPPLRVLLLGSTVHDLYFPGWPVMQDGLVPEFSSRYIALHYTHRILAGLGFLYLVWLAWRGWRTARPEPWLLLAAAGAFTVNVALGAVHVFTEVSSAAVVALHLLFAALAWAAAVGAAALAWGWHRSAA
jgi:heme A synthase